MRLPIRPLAAALVLFAAAPPSVLLPSASFAQAQPDASSEEVKQVAITARQIENYITAKKDMDAIIEKAPPDAGDKPDPAFLARLDAAAKKYAFADYSEYDDVANNIGLAMDGIDPQTRKYVGSAVILKQELAAVQADSQMPAKDKKEALDQINAALKNPPKLEFPANADLVVKYYDKLMAAMPQQ